MTTAELVQLGITVTAWAILFSAFVESCLIAYELFDAVVLLVDVEVVRCGVAVFHEPLPLSLYIFRPCCFVAVVVMHDSFLLPYQVFGIELTCGPWKTLCHPVVQWSKLWGR